MKSRVRIVLALAGLLVLVAACAITIFVWKDHYGDARDRFVGAWQGEGSARPTMSVNLKQPSPANFNAPIALRTSIQATFERDGTMRMSWSSRAEGFHFSFDVPDPKKPGDVSRWRATRAADGSILLRLMEPDNPAAPEWRVTFNGKDEFTAVPSDPAKGTDAIVFRRAGK